MNDMWAVRLIPSGSTNSCTSETDARTLADMVRGTDTPGCEILHLEDGGWRVVERFEPSGEAELPRIACTGCDWHGTGLPGTECPQCSSETCFCQCGEVEAIGRAAEHAAREILAREDRGGR